MATCVYVCVREKRGRFIVVLYHHFDYYIIIDKDNKANAQMFKIAYKTVQSNRDKHFFN